MIQTFLWKSILLFTPTRRIKQVFQEKEKKIGKDEVRTYVRVLGKYANSHIFPLIFPQQTHLYLYITYVMGEK